MAAVLCKESETVGAVAWRVIRNPWQAFVVDWNWKAAVLSAGFRAVAFAAPMVGVAGAGTARSVFIELVYRVVVGGSWGSLMQAFRAARPLWLAGFCVAVLLPGSAHMVEYAALRMGGATHIKTAMVISIFVSIGSMLINWSLMRRGLLVTGDGTATLAADLRRVPSALCGMLRSSFLTVRRMGRAI